MKDATGELSMTAIAVVAIAAVAGIFTIFIYPRIRASLINSAACQSAVCQNCGTDAATCDCNPIDQNTGEMREDTIKCPNPNLSKDGAGADDFLGGGGGKIVNFR